MDKDDEELAHELRGLLRGSGYATAFGDEQDTEAADAADAAEEEPFGDFFLALSAYRAARASGDGQAEAEAEERLRDVVRAELAGN